MPESGKKIVAVLNDLLFAVKIQDAAKRAGLGFAFVKSQEEALARAAEKPALMILDLNDKSTEPLELIGRLKADAATRGLQLVGYVSHVQTELRQAAADRGCDIVMARSAFVQNLAGLLEKCATTERTGPDSDFLSTT